MLKWSTYIIALFLSHSCISQNLMDKNDADSEIDGAIQSQKIVDASDGIYSNGVRVKWQYKQQSGGSYSVYRNTSEEEPGDRIRTNINTPQISDRRAESGVLYYYTIFFKSSNSTIRPIGKDSGYKKSQQYAIEEQELIAGIQDSGNINFGIDSLRIIPLTPDNNDKLEFEYHITNTTSHSLSKISLKFWLSEDPSIDSTDKLLLTKYLERLPKDESIQEQLKASILSSIVIGDYYLIGETTIGGKSISQLNKTVSIQ